MNILFFILTAWAIFSIIYYFILKKKYTTKINCINYKKTFKKQINGAIGKIEVEAILFNDKTGIDYSLPYMDFSDMTDREIKIYLEDHFYILIDNYPLGWVSAYAPLLIELPYVDQKDVNKNRVLSIVKNEITKNENKKRNKNRN